MNVYRARNGVGVVWKPDVKNKGPFVNDFGNSLTRVNDFAPFSILFNLANKFSTS